MQVGWVGVVRRKWGAGEGEKGDMVGTEETGKRVCRHYSVFVLSRLQM